MSFVLVAELARAGGAGQPPWWSSLSSLDEAGFISELSFPSEKPAPSIVKVDRDDNVWVALARVGKIGRISKGVLREYALPPNSFPVGIAIDEQGKVWFSDIRRNKICQLDPLTGALAEHDVPTPASWPFYIVVAQDGRLYFTERVGNKIGRLDPRSGEIVELLVPTPNSSPAGMAVGVDGAIYFTENSGNRIGRVDPESGEIREFEVPSRLIASPFYGLAGIAADRTGKVWFAEVDGRLGVLDPKQGRIEEIPLPNRAGRPAGMAVDEEGLIWFTELDGNAITSFNPRLGAFRSYPIPTGKPDLRPKGPPEATARGELPVPGFMAQSSRPFGIAVDRRGRIWFSEQYGHKVGVLEPPPVEIFGPAGRVRGRRVPLAVQLRGVAANADVSYRIDGREVEARQELDLSRLQAGPHELAVELLERGGGRFRTVSTFEVVPSLEKVEALLEGAARPQELAPGLRAELLATVAEAIRTRADGDAAASRTAVRTLLSRVSDGAEELAPALRELLLADLRYLDLFEEREIELQVAATDPYLARESVDLEVGDALVWRLPAKGAPAVRRPEDGYVVRTSLAEGGFRDSFPREGEFLYSLGEQPERPERVLRVLVRPRSPRIVELPLPGPGRVPGVMAVDHRGDAVWFTGGGGGFLQLGQVPLNNKIGRVDLQGKIQEFSTPSPESGPTSITVAPDGRVWFTQRGTNSLAVFDPGTTRFTEYPIPTAASVATGIASGPDGRIWYASKLASRVGVLEPRTGEIEEYATPSPASEPSTIMVDPEGVVWFDERANDKIVRLDPEDGSMREFKVPTESSRVVGLVPDSSGHIWFLQLGGNKVGRLDKTTGDVVEFTVPTPRASPFKLTLDRFGRVWFSQAFGNRIGMLAEGKFYEFLVPTPEAMPGGIAIDDAGNVWFSEQAKDQLGLIAGAALVRSGSSEPAQSPLRRQYWRAGPGTGVAP